MGGVIQGGSYKKNNFLECFFFIEKSDYFWPKKWLKWVKSWLKCTYLRCKVLKLKFFFEKMKKNGLLFESALTKRGRLTLFFGLPHGVNRDVRI